VTHAITFIKPISPSTIWHLPHLLIISIIETHTHPACIGKISNARRRTLVKQEENYIIKITKYSLPNEIAELMKFLMNRCAKSPEIRAVPSGLPVDAC
jgi:hypothetical protein